MARLACEGYEVFQRLGRGDRTRTGPVVKAAANHAFRVCLSLCKFHHTRTDWESCKEPGCT
jgi:hypothetical protein